MHSSRGTGHDGVYQNGSGGAKLSASTCARDLRVAAEVPCPLLLAASFSLIPEALEPPFDETSGGTRTSAFAFADTTLALETVAETDIDMAKSVIRRRCAREEKDTKRRGDAIIGIEGLMAPNDPGVALLAP